MCHSDDVNHERCGLPLKNKTYCISRVTEKCKDSKKGTLASYGIWAWLNASHCKLIVWCSPCAQVEWELRDTPEEDRTDKQKRCTSKLPGSCNGKTVPSYGLPENARLWCAPCAQREWEDRGTPEDERMDAQRRCTSQLDGSCGGKKQPSFGLPENARLWCGACAELEWEDRGTPEDERVDALRRCTSELDGSCGGKKVPMYGLLGAPKLWCRRCAQLEWDDRGTPEEDRVDSQRKCTSKLDGSCGGKTVTSYGLPGATYLWCGPCAKLEWEDRGTPEDERVDAFRRCTSELDGSCGGKTVPSYGLPGARFLWCSACAQLEWQQRGTPDEERVNGNRKCAWPECKKQAHSGTTAEPRKWCAIHALFHWTANSVPMPNRVNSQGKMPAANRSYSRVSIECLDWHAKKLGVDIQHAETRAVRADELEADEVMGEHLLVVPGHRWRADGFSKVNGLLVCWEFHGCVWHGCARCFPDRNRSLNGMSMAERYSATVNRTAKIRLAGYSVIEVWECDWEALLEDEDRRNAHLNAVRQLLNQQPAAPKRTAGTLDGFVVRKRASTAADDA